ncbi:B3 domain-containing protein [Sesamum alatum]|uniref:B3 domain-containing protein n=1 Tax=Sesamum alatum TaxID=300844 RepID=A0AAE1Z3Y0_9LAMI|nr:B3 domain-containing protein [Sesamum alatum]
MASFSHPSSSSTAAKSHAAEKLEPHHSSILPTFYTSQYSPEFIDFLGLEEKQGDETEPAGWDVSTELSLGCPNYSPRRVVVPTDDDDDELHQPTPAAFPAEDINNWGIIKELRGSDVDGSSRLMLKRRWVKDHILPHVNMGNGLEGVELVVWDVDTGSEHALVLKKWKSGSFVLMKNWMSNFVRRRGLKKKDEIGLRWDYESSRLEFTVIKKN